MVTIVYVKSVSPGPVITDLLLSLVKRSQDPNSTDQISNINGLCTEDVANGIISTLATPPNVLVSNFSHNHFDKQWRIYEDNVGD